jgi:hypothetical protein
MQEMLAPVDYTNLPLPEVRTFSHEAFACCLSFYQGWEMAYTPEGVPYFIDHKRQTTCWTGMIYGDAAHAVLI